MIVLHKIVPIQMILILAHHAVQVLNISFIQALLLLHMVNVYIILAVINMASTLRIQYQEKKYVLFLVLL